METGAVLSAFLSREVLHDIDTSNPGRTITIVVMRNPDCRICAKPPIGPERPILVCTVREITRVFGTQKLVCAISKNDPGQFLPEQYIFKEPQYRRAFTKRGSGSFR